MSGEFSVFVWRGKCVNEKSDKFYDLIAVSNSGGMEWRTLALAGKNGYSGIAQKIKYFDGTGNLERFLNSKKGKGYVIHFRERTRENSAEVRTKLMEFMDGVTKTDNLPKDWLSEMLFHKSAAQPLTPAKATAAPKKAAPEIEPSSSYGESWGAWA